MHKKFFFKMGSVPAMLAVLLVAPIVHAATSPGLGAAATYSVLSSTYTNTSAGTSINGDIGFTTGPAVVPGGTHANFGSGAPYATAGTDQGNAASALAAQPCIFTFAPGAIDLSTDTTHGPIGVYTPGVYCSAGAMDIGGPLTLNGNGTYIFRPDGALTSTAGAVVTLSGASACDVFWTPTQATTLGANTTFAGTVIDAAGITVGANTTWTGFALAFGGTITTDTDTLTVATCAIPPVPILVPVVVPVPTSTPVIVPTSTLVIAPIPTPSPVLVPVFVQAPVPTLAPVPQLPNTGVSPASSIIAWIAGLAALFVVATLLLALTTRKRSS